MVSSQTIQEPGRREEPVRLDIVCRCLTPLRPSRNKIVAMHIYQALPEVDARVSLAA